MRAGRAVGAAAVRRDDAWPTCRWRIPAGSTCWPRAGMRVCIAPMFRSARWFTKNGHVVEYEWDEAAGEKAMAEALGLIERAEQHPSGRLFGMVVPAQIDTCTEGLLRESHAGGGGARPAVADPRRAVGRSSSTRSPAGTAFTPIGWLDELGLLSERSIIGHGIFLDDHPSTRWHTDTRPRAPGRDRDDGGALPDRVRPPRHHAEGFRPLPARRASTWASAPTPIRTTCSTRCGWSPTWRAPRPARRAR